MKTLSFAIVYSFLFIFVNPTFAQNIQCSFKVERDYEVPNYKICLRASAFSLMGIETFPIYIDGVEYNRYIELIHDSNNNRYSNLLKFTLNFDLGNESFIGQADAFIVSNKDINFSCVEVKNQCDTDAVLVYSSEEVEATGLSQPAGIHLKSR